MKESVLRETCTELSEAGIPFLLNEPLSGHCTFRIGGPAALFISPDTEDRLIKAVSVCREKGIRFYLLGCGSNILFDDDGFDGAVIHLTALPADIKVQGTRVSLSAGVRLSVLCQQALQASLGGFEFAYGIPGTVGGAVYMNAGAYGGEIRDILVSCRCLMTDGTIREFSADSLSLSYRHSILEENGACVLSAEFEGKPAEKEAVRSKMDELMQKRQEKQPLDKPSAGSTFKRPAGAFAAALIDQCGLRGYSVGDAAVSTKHCGFVVNLGHAGSADVLELCSRVSDVVKEKTGYTLEKEIRVVPFLDGGKI